MATGIDILLQNGIALVHDGDSDRVRALHNTDILICDGHIRQIGNNLGITSEARTEVIDCTDKIISPGFVDTHHHLWESQLKGRCVDETLFDYMVSEYIQSYNYLAEDVFLGQLAGALECIDVGTTTVVDHCHACRDEECATQALSALISSGIRAVFAYTPPGIVIREWTQTTIATNHDPVPERSLAHIEQLAQNQPYANDRVKIGFGFDAFYMGDEFVKRVFDRMKKAGVHGATSHVCKNAIFGTSSTIDVLERTALLNYPNYILSHCNGLTNEEYMKLAKSTTYISSTPETEAQMALGWPLLFHRELKASVGIDCHTNNSAFLPHSVRAALLLARQQANQPLLDRGEYPLHLVGSSQQAFNAMTINGARAVGLQDTIGSIAVGKAADLVIFDTSSTGMATAVQVDPLAAVVRFADVRDVDTVMVAGHIRKRQGKLCSIAIQDIDGKVYEETSWHDLRHRVRQSQREILERIRNCGVDVAKDLVKNTFHIDETKIV